MRHGKVIVITSFLLIIISCKKKPEINYFSYQYAKYIHDNPGYDKTTLKEKNKAKKTAGKLFNKVKKLSRQGDYYNTIIIYKKILTLYADADIYYNFAYSLYKDDEFNNALKAYEIALKLGFRNKGRLFFSLALCNNKLENISKTLLYIKKSVENKYYYTFHFNLPVFAYLQNNIQNWSEYYSRLIIKRLTNMKIVILCGSENESVVCKRIYHFLPDNVVKFTDNGGGNKTYQNEKTGTWKVNENIIQITYNKITRYLGIGAQSGILSGNYKYKKYKKITELVNIPDVLDWINILKKGKSHPDTTYKYIIVKM